MRRLFAGCPLFLYHSSFFPCFLDKTGVLRYNSSRFFPIFRQDRRFLNDFCRSVLHILLPAALLHLLFCLPEHLGEKLRSAGVFARVLRMGRAGLGHYARRVRLPQLPGGSGNRQNAEAAGRSALHEAHSDCVADRRYRRAGYFQVQRLFRGESQRAAAYFHPRAENPAADRHFVLHLPDALVHD